MLVLGDVVVGGGLSGIELLVGDGGAGRPDGELLQGVLEPPRILCEAVTLGEEV